MVELVGCMGGYDSGDETVNVSGWKNIHVNAQRGEFSFLVGWFD